jgi:hypothetical protein
MTIIQPKESHGPEFGPWHRHGEGVIVSRCPL